MKLRIAAALASLSISLASGSVLSQSRGNGHYLATTIELRAARASDAEQLEIVESDLRSTKPRRRAVTDLLLRLSADGGAIDVALQAANETTGGRPKPLLQAELYLVVDGRIEGPVLATCDRWRADTSLCRLECDGGGMTLRRSARQQLALVVTGTGSVQDTERPVLNACRAGEAEVTLAPRGGGGLVIPLAAR